jgi:redox-sensitive bicupin YhaK (pirin superfamily)
MEIVSYILSGALRHRDSLGNSAVMRAGDVQRISAGSGVMHSEFNDSPTEPVHFLQIWILPSERGGVPDYAERSFAGAAPNGWTLVASGDARDGSLAIRQDANIWLAVLEPGAELDLPVGARSERGVWCHIAKGAVALDGERLAAGDAMAVEEEPASRIRASEPTEVLCFDLA